MILLLKYKLLEISLNFGDRKGRIAPPSKILRSVIFYFTDESESSLGSSFQLPPTRQHSPHSRKETDEESREDV